MIAPKGVTGEYGGGFLAAGLAVAAGARPGPTAGLREPDPELGLSPWTGGELAAPRVSLLTALASGGAAGWALVAPPAGKPEPPAPPGV